MRVLGFNNFFIKEPVRGSSEIEGGSGDAKLDRVNKTSGFAAFVTDCKSVLRVKSFVWASLGQAAVSFTAGGLAIWAPQLYVRQLDYSSSKASYIFGAVTVVTGICGTIWGAYLSKIYTPKSEAADGIICGMSLLVCTPFLCLGLALVPYSAGFSWALLFFAELFICVNWAPVAALVLYILPVPLRSSGESYFFSDITWLCYSLSCHLLSQVWRSPFSCNICLATPPVR